MSSATLRYPTATGRAVPAGTVAALVLAILVGACAYQSTPLGEQEPIVAPTTGSKVPGRFGLFVDLQNFKAEARPAGLTCSAHTFPLDAEAYFRDSASRNLAIATDRLEPVDEPLRPREIRSRNLKGAITVVGGFADVFFKVKPSLLTATVESRVNVSASLAVDGRRGRAMTKTVETSAREEGPAGLACERGAEVLAEAARKAIDAAVKQLVEAFLDDPQVRSM